MKTEERKLNILCETKKDAQFLKELLEYNIYEKITIHDYSFEEGFTDSLDNSLVLIPGEFLYEKAVKICPNSKIITAKRVIISENLEKVMILPRGKKVLVINYPSVVTVDTINNLKELGLTHLEYVPFVENSGDTYEDIDTVITPAHLHLCPTHIKNRIDLGKRTIDFSTCLELIMELGLDIKNINNFTRHYNQIMIKAGYKVASLLLKTEKLSKNMETAFSKIKDSIIVIDENNCISAFNTASEELFEMQKGEVLGKRYNDVFREYPDFHVLLQEEDNVHEALVDIQAKRVVVSITYIKNEDVLTRLCTLSEVLSIQNTEENVRRKLYKRGYVAKYTFDSIDGSSRAIKDAIHKAMKFSKTNNTVLIIGESGTGKELFAQAIHNSSYRCNGPFLGINFAAIPDNLVESELFGYEEGAFTGALKGGKAGLFEQAHKGTIFLDEIGDATPAIQSRLLRVLQEREVMRLGASKVIPIDVRVIAATNKDLLELVEKGTFRKDLYYRLNVLPIIIPPLRQRKEDIAAIMEGIIARFGKKIIIPESIIAIFRDYQWPGNVRELENTIQYISVIKDKEIIEINDLPPRLIGKEPSVKSALDVNDALENDIQINGQDLYFILQRIYQANQEGKVIGRQMLAELSREQGYSLTDSKLKTRLKKLTVDGFIKTGKTKQGSIITPKGIELMRRVAPDNTH